MDALTADNEVVLASLGGKPRMPEDINEQDDEKFSNPVTNEGSDNTIDAVDEDEWTAAERGVPRDGIRERAGNWKGA